MSTGCECPLAGYCDRHKSRKIGRLHHLCQHDDRYWDMWERGIGPGQSEQVAAREARQARVIAARAKTNRLIGWIKSCRQPGDAGVGDTASRLRAMASRPSDIHTLIKRLMQQCDCQPADSIARLNADHKYE